MQHGREAALPAKRIVHRPEESFAPVHFVDSGWLLRTRSLPNGNSAATATYVPGDFINLDAITEPTFPETVTTLSAVRVRSLPTSTLEAATQLHPGLSLAIMRRLIADADWLREALAAIGQLNARTRVLVYVYQTYRRLVANGVVPARATAFAFPVHQTALGTIIGTTSVHVNRVLKQLRQENVLKLKSGEIIIADFARFEREATHYLF